MKILVDLRSLQSGTVSGVENYTQNLVSGLLRIDRQNYYKLFYNSFKAKSKKELTRVNAQTIITRYPNRLLNLAFKSSLANFERLAGDFDVLLMPNLNPFRVSDKKKVAIVVHDLSFAINPNFYDWRGKLWHKFLNFKRNLKRADLIFCVSKHTKNDLLEMYGINPNKVSVIYPGIDHSEFNLSVQDKEKREARNKLGLPGEFFLFINTLEPRKNLISLMKAFELYKGPEYLVVAGKLGWKVRKILQQMKFSPKSEKIVYLGYVEERFKTALISMAKALIYPSFYEGFGFQPLEAFACGTPVIASHVSSIPEITQDAALLINPYSIGDLTQALDLVANDFNLRQALIKKGVLRAKNFNWESTCELILEKINLIF